MATSQGFGKISAANSLVFAYDAGDMRNSYIGQPGRNYANGPYYGVGASITNFENGKIYRTNGYKETVYIPTLGVREVDCFEIYNEYDGYGTNGNFNCCPNIYSYTDGGWNAFPWLPNTTYTYQIIYKSETGYTNPNYMYHYEYRADGSYITEYGVHTNELRTHLGDGWYHAWNTFTTHPEANKGYCGMWHYEYYGVNKVSLAAVSIVPGTTIRPPLQFINEGTTRSSTQALLDLTGASSINVANLSFNTAGELAFDGTDDYIIVSPNQPISLADYAMEVVFSVSSLPGKRHYLIDPRGNGGEPNSPMYLLFDDNGSQIQIIGGNSNIEVNSGYRSVTLNKYYHLVCTRIGSTCKLYLNGAEVGSGDTGASELGITEPFRIGTYAGATSGQYFLNGKIPVAKMYSTGLTSDQVTQNYNHYKNRFNL